MTTVCWTRSTGQFTGLAARSTATSISGEFSEELFRPSLPLWLIAIESSDVGRECARKLKLFGDGKWLTLRRERPQHTHEKTGVKTTITLDID